MKRENLKIFRQSLTEYADQHMNNVPSSPTLELEGMLNPSDINRNFLNFMLSLDPFGSSNPVPVFLAKGIQVIDTRTVGAQGSHLKITLDSEGKFFDGIAFRDGHRRLECKGSVDIAYTPTINYWNGRESVELLIKDFRPTTKI